MARVSLKFLSKEEKDRIHVESLSILEDVGLEVLDSEALDILSHAGARVDRQTNRIRFPPEMVNKALEQAPSSIKLYGRDIGSVIHLKPGNVYYSTNGYAVHLYDEKTGTRRVITQEDLTTITRLMDSLDQIDVYNVAATPEDAPPDTNDRYQLAIALTNTSKHIWNTAYGREGVHDAVAMASAIRGSKETLFKYPLFTLDLTTLSPLQLDERQTSTMVEGAQQGLPIGISPGPIAGATGPVTLAGTLTQANAEVLGAITLCQVVNPGVPVIYTQYTRSLDMRTGGVTMGGPEFSLLRIATAEMARYYRLPSRGGGMIADAKASDAQMGAEKMLNCLMASLAGLNVLAGAGAADFINTVRMDQMVIDNEIIRIVRKMMKGFEINEGTIAKEVIKEVGPGGNYLTHDHTALNFKAELWFPELWDRKTWSVWEAEGGLEVADRAKETLRTLPLRPPLNEEVAQKVWNVVHEADRKYA